MHTHYIQTYTYINMSYVLYYLYINTKYILCRYVYVPN